jgi:hypothetical protein
MNGTGHIKHTHIQPIYLIYASKHERGMENLAYRLRCNWIDDAMIHKIRLKSAGYTKVDIRKVGEERYTEV